MNKYNANLHHLIKYMYSESICYVISSDSVKVQTKAYCPISFCWRSFEIRKLQCITDKSVSYAYLWDTRNYPHRLSEVNIDRKGINKQFVHLQLW